MKRLLQKILVLALLVSSMNVFAQSNSVFEQKFLTVSDIINNKSYVTEIKETILKLSINNILIDENQKYNFRNYYKKNLNNYKQVFVDFFTKNNVVTGSVLKNETTKISNLMLDDFLKLETDKGFKMENFVFYPPVSLNKLHENNDHDGTMGAGEPCNNMGIENCNFTAWNLTKGEVDGANPYSFINPVPTTNWGNGSVIGFAGINSSGTDQHFIVNPGIDPNVPIQMVNPLNGGSCTALLGDGNGTGYMAAKMSQTFLVDTSNANFSYSYAAVMQDPGHSLAQQPYFKARVLDQFNNQIFCGDYSAYAGDGSAGWIPTTLAGENGQYKDWSTVIVPLGAYIGTNVTIEFTTGDCGAGGHFGYAYVEASCDPLQIVPSDTVVCGAPVTLNAPSPFNGTYLWSTGETTASITTNTPGLYTVDLITKPGCFITLEINLVADSMEYKADFIADTVCQGIATSFTDLSTISTGTISAWSWDFQGDGTVDNTSQNPTFIYPMSGTFSANLSIGSGVCGHDTTINVTVLPATTANFTAPSVCQGVATSFTNTSTPAASITNWNWDFDNDGSYDNTNQNPNSTFATAGTYPVNLQVTLAGGSCPKDTTINVVVNPNPVANFTGTNECLTTATTFSDGSSVSSGSITGWAWDFDNNTTTDNTTQNPTNTYTTAGTHTINLTVTTDSSCTALFSTTVQVYNNPVANFSTDTACNTYATSFTDLTAIGNFGIQTWNWDYDNNGSADANEQNPSFIFSGAGTYPVNLAVIDTFGCVHDTTLDVTVSENPIAAFTYSNVCFGTATTFTNLSSDNGGTTPIDTWEWDYDGNGTIDDTTQTPTYIFPAAGTYQTELYVTSVLGCKDSAEVAVVVDPIPVANFSGTNECFGITTTFIDSSNVSTGTIANWDWDFETDATIDDNNQNPTFVYPSVGIHNVTLTVTTDSGCTHTFNTNVEVYANPIANFSTDTACNTYATSFTDLTAIGNFGIQTWNWDYDNNGSADANEQNPSFIFSGAGTYPVNLAVTDTFGCVHDTTIDVTVSENPIAAFTYSNVCFGTATTFTNLSSDNGGTTPIDTWEWDYEGNGSIDITMENPTNTFSSAGTYQTTLYVTSVLGCKDTATVEVVVDPIPVANFTATSECFEYITMFTNTSTITTGTIAQNDWDFDDGSPIDNNIDPTHIYGSSGTFNVELTVTSDSGCTHSVVVPVIVFPKPTADFTTADICQNLTAQFTDQSNDNGGTITQYDWDIDFDGITHTTDYTSINATNNYAVANTYTVELIVTTFDGCKDTVSNPIIIHPMPVADFTYINDCVDAGIDFTNTSTVSSGTVDVWEWQFGDAQTSAIENPTNNYVLEGIYDVKLVVTTNNNCKDSVIKNDIEVWPLPVVNFSPTSVCLNDSTQFTDLSTVSNLYTVNNNVAWSWDFADGIGTSSAQRPIYMYTTDGIFNATLTVTTDHNCVNDTTLPVTVHPLPVVDFTPDIFDFCTPVCVTFADSTKIQSTDGSFINEWDWDFNGDEITDSENQYPQNCFINPSHSSVRDFDIRLIATSNFGCKDTLVKEDYIHSYPIPLASFTYWPNDEASIVDNDITFTDQSIIGAVWNWNLGDGTLTNVQHPVHEYTDTGYYLVELKIENIYGCIDSTQKYVNIKPIYAIWIPNAFTPNGDFTNDFFYVNGYGIKELQVMIFNRWGEKIYDDIGVEQIWDGFYKGNLVQTDVYVYKVRAKDIFDEWHDYIGKVSVIR